MVMVMMMMIRRDRGQRIERGITPFKFSSVLSHSKHTYCRINPPNTHHTPLLYNLSGVDMAPNASSSTQSRFDMLTAYTYNASSQQNTEDHVTLCLLSKCRKSGDAYGKIGLDAEVARVRAS